MGARARAWWGGGLLVVLLGAAHAAEPLPAEVRVLSQPGAAPSTTITIRALPDTAVDDRTPGARKSAASRGPVSGGDTFSDEVTLFLPGAVVARPASIDVADALVSAVRINPEGDGTSVVIFIRQPVTYVVSRPSGAGEVTVALRARTVPAAPGKPGHRKLPTMGGAARAGGGEVSIDAAELTHDQETDTMIARGGVTLTRGAVTLQADEVQYHRPTGVADARGNVVLKDPQSTITGDVAHMNMEDESGWVDRANVDLDASGYRLVAGKLEKGLGPTYAADEGVFTTCRCGGLERPSWSLGGKRTDVKVGGLGLVREATFRVKDVPVFYFPLLAFPANTDRETGFLMPRVGYSARRGFQYEQPFFWAIDKSSDATVALDVETNLRVGVIGEYRWIQSQKARGVFTFAYYNESLRGPNSNDDTLPPSGGVEDIPINRFAFAGRYQQPFYLKSLWYVDLFAVSDQLFLRDIDNFSNTVSGDLVIRTTRLTRSRTGILKTWEGGLAQIDTTYYQDLIDKQDLVPQRLPQVRAEQSIPLLGDRIVGRLSGSAIDFQREQGFSGIRGDVFPELFLPFRLGRWMSGSVTGLVRETAYHLTDDRQVGLYSSPVLQNFRSFRQLEQLDRDHTREIAEVRGRLGTEWSRTFRFNHFGFAKLRHSIEPEVRYLYVPGVDDQFVQQPLNVLRINPGAPANVPARFRLGCTVGDPNCFAGSAFARGYLFDEVDAINRRSFFSYGLSTRLLGRAATGEEAATPLGEDLQGPPTPGPSGAPPAARELFRLSVLHGWDSSRELVGTSHFSDLDLGLRITPLDWLGASWGSTWNVRRNEIVAQNVGFVFREPWWTPPAGNRFQGASQLAVAYSFVENNVNHVRGLPPGVGFSNQGNEDVIGSLYLRLGDYVGFNFIARYDLDGGNFLDNNNVLKFAPPGFLERDYIMRIISRCNCWMVEVGVADRFNPDETLYRVQVTLLGLGSFGKGTGNNFVGFAPLQTLGLRRPSALGAGY